MGSNQKRRSRNEKQAIILVVVAVLLALGYFAFDRHVKESYNAQKQRIELSEVRFRRPDGSVTREFSLEVARSRADQAKGLMYRKSMDEFKGMVFVYDNESVKEFWMKNTYIELDMIFIDSNGKLVGILNDVPILNETVRKVSAASRAVVELVAGSAKRFNISEGAQAEFSSKLW